MQLGLAYLSFGKACVYHWCCKLVFKWDPCHMLAWVVQVRQAYTTCGFGVLAFPDDAVRDHGVDTLICTLKPRRTLDGTEVGLICVI